MENNSVDLSGLVCADCGEKELVSVDILYNVAICENCSAVHRQLRKTDEQIKRISEVSRDSIQNVSVNEELEKFLPLIPLKQGIGMHESIRKIFIFHKYNSRTYAIESHYNNFEPSAGVMSAYILKKGKQGRTWKYRFFVLKNGCLNYFVDDNFVPKNSMEVDKLSMLVETLENDTYQLTVNYLPGSSRSRTYYLTFTTAKDLYNWYFAILTAQSFVVGRVDMHPSPQIMSGFLYKVGTCKLNKWRKRWVTFNNGHLMYFSEKDSPHPVGEFDIGGKDKGYDVRVGDVDHIVSAPNKHTFCIVTPSRVYKLCAENQLELNSWIEVIKDTIQIH